MVTKKGMEQYVLIFFHTKKKLWYKKIENVWESTADYWWLDNVQVTIMTDGSDRSFISSDDVTWPSFHGHKEGNFNLWPWSLGQVVTTWLKWLKSDRKLDKWYITKIGLQMHSCAVFELFLCNCHDTEKGWNLYLPWECLSLIHISEPTRPY